MGPLDAAKTHFFYLDLPSLQADWLSWPIFSRDLIPLRLPTHHEKRSQASAAERP
jgi:hypothetical protein